MVELVRAERFDQRQFIGDRLQTRQQIREWKARLAAARKLKIERPRRAEHDRELSHKREFPGLEQFLGTVFAAALCEFWFEIKEVEVRRCAHHVDVDNAFGLRLAMGPPKCMPHDRFQSPPSRSGVIATAQTHHAETQFLEKGASTDRLDMRFVRRHGRSMRTL